MTIRWGEIASAILAVVSLPMVRIVVAIAVIAALAGRPWWAIAIAVIVALALWGIWWLWRQLDQARGPDAKLPPGLTLKPCPK